MTKNQYSQYRPHIHKLDSYYTGWQVFPDEPDIVKEYGNVHVKWTLSAPIVNSYGHSHCNTVLHMSIDAGATWKNSDGWYGLYAQHFNPHSGWNKEHYAGDIPSILAAKAKHIRDRAKERAKKKRDAFKALSPEAQAKQIAAKQAVKAKQTARLQVQKEKATSAVMTQLLELGPELVKIRDRADEAIKLMGAGGINKEFPYYARTFRDIGYARSLLEDRIAGHVKRCQKNKKKEAK